MPEDEAARVASIFNGLAAERKPFWGLRNVNLHKDGRQVTLEANGVPILDTDGNFRGYRGIDRDITSRDRAEQALRESEERFRLVANTAPVMIWMAGTDRMCNYLNRPWLDFVGAPLGEQLGNGWLKAVHPEDATTCFRTYMDAFDEEKSFEMQYRVRRHDGQYRWVLDFGVPRFNTDGSFAGYIGSCIDITERKQAEEALATVGRRLIEAHEEERTWIGRELHDDINQRLALLSVEMDRWLKDHPHGAPVRELIDLAQQRISEIAKDVQNLSHRLHSSKLDYLGLAKAANSFCRELSNSSNVEVTFRNAGVPHILPKETSLCLFRVLQEALQNAVKHSGVHSFKVDLYASSDSIELKVEDAGIGFDPVQALGAQGIGLISMRERLQLVHGNLSVQSKPGRGTVIHARVPLPDPASQALAG
jgi:PAS domain S-box-containing protein